MGNERRGESQSFEMKAGLLVLLLSVAGLQNVDAAGFVLSTEDPSKPGGWDAAMGWMVCPANHHVVDTHSECITAAADLGIGCGSEPEDLANWPKGCYVKPDGDYNVVMFNAHTTGGTANNDAAPICAPDAPSFVMGTPGTLATCPAGHAVVGTQSECETAAADLGLTFGLSEDDANWPKGCYLSIDASRFYFNTHATGAANACATPICSDAPFVLGAKNTNGIASCPDYYSIVDTEAKCITAAADLEESKGYQVTEDDANWPKGCYISSGDLKVFFNTHATGAANGSGAPICARDASTEETLTCQYIKTSYKNQNCCGNPQGPFVVPTSRRLQSTSLSHGGRYDPHQAVDQVVEEFTNWNTLLNQGLINVQEYSARKTRLLESLV